VGKYCGGEKILSPPGFQHCGGERPRRPRRSDASGDGSLVRKVTGPKGHWSEGSLVRKVTGPKGQWSAGSVVRRVSGPKGQWSEGSLVRRISGPKAVKKIICMSLTRLALAINNNNEDNKIKIIAK